MPESPTCTEVGRGKRLAPSLLKSEDVRMLAAAADIFLWIGLGASAAEGRSSFRLAMDYLKANGGPLATPIHVFKEGQRVHKGTWNGTFGLKGVAGSSLACFSWCGALSRRRAACRRLARAGLRSGRAGDGHVEGKKHLSLRCLHTLRCALARPLQSTAAAASREHRRCVMRWR